MLKLYAMPGKGYWDSTMDHCHGVVFTVIFLFILFQNVHVLMIICPSCLLNRDLERTGEKDWTL